MMRHCVICGERIEDKDPDYKVYCSDKCRRTNSNINKGFYGKNKKRPGTIYRKRILDALVIRTILRENLHLEGGNILDVIDKVIMSSELLPGEYSTKYKYIIDNVADVIIFVNHMNKDYFRNYGLPSDIIYLDINVDEYTMLLSSIVVERLLYDEYNIKQIVNKRLGILEKLKYRKRLKEFEKEKYTKISDSSSPHDYILTTIVDLLMEACCE